MRNLESDRTYCDRFRLGMGCPISICRSAGRRSETILRQQPRQDYLAASVRAANLEDAWARSSLIVAISFLEWLLHVSQTSMLDSVGSCAMPTN